MNTRTTIILLVVAIALGAGMLMLFNQEQKDAQQPVAVAAKAQDLFAPKPGPIVQVRVEQPDRPARLFEQRNDDWFIAEPIRGRAQKAALQEDAHTLGELQYTQKYDAGNPEAPGEELSGLKQPSAVVTLKDKSGAAHTLRIGNVRPMTGDETYVTKDTDPAIYVIKQNLVTKFARPLNDYRERRVTEIPYNDITRLQVSGAQNYEAVKAGEEWVLEQPVRGRTDRPKIEAVAQAAINLSTETFVADDDANLKIYGLTQPQLQLAVTTEKKPAATQPAGTQPAASQPASQPAEIKTTTILVGGKAGTQYFAKLADQPGVFQISETVFKTINTPLPDLRDKTIAQVEPARVKGLDITVGGQSAMLVKQNGRWQMAGSVVGPAETSAVEDLLKALGQAKATAFEDDPKPQLTTYGFESPRAHLRVVSEGKVDPVEILVGANTPSGEMTFVRNAADGVIAVLKKPEADALVVQPLALLERSVFSFAAQDVEKIELTREGRTVTLVRQGETWNMTEPANAAGDSAAVAAVLADLASLRARKVVAVGEDASYGLTTPQVTVKIHAKDRAAASRPATQPAVLEASLAATQPAASQPAEKVYTLLVSRKDTDAYARLADGTWVYQIDPVVAAHLVAELRDRAVVKIDPEQAAAIKVPTDSGEIIELAKKGEKWSCLADPFVEIDTAKVKEWLGLLAGTRAERFVAYNVQDTGGYGLDKPLYETEVTLASGQNTRLIVAKATDTGKYVATVAGTTAVFELPATSVKQLQKPLSFFKGQ